MDRNRASAVVSGTGHGGGRVSHVQRRGRRRGGDEDLWRKVGVNIGTAIVRPLLQKNPTRGIVGLVILSRWVV